ncbi:hypothetical protein [Kitasatospora sp. NPDC050463]|uniref:hypothetical protein n=1 Tax=Kitasatospora sp. NPDC050463 TaxID=3155786 RepID=UPI0033F459B3
MLHVNPKMLPRLDELEQDLPGRRQRAEAEGWIGEIEGIDLPSPSFAASNRRIHRAVIDLGIPPRDFSRPAVEGKEEPQPR